MSMQIGPYVLPNAIFVAPMAGVTDRPFRQLCRQFGAGYAVSEMVTSRCDHFAHSIARTKLSAQLAKRPICDARHRRYKNSIG